MLSTPSLMSRSLRALAALSVATAVAPLVPLALNAQAPNTIPTIDDATLQPKTITIGGAPVLPTTRTVAHWWSSAVDPNNGVTYGYNMVGADPDNCSGAACSVTVVTDITPIKVVVGGLTFDGTDVVAATLASPLFTLNDYGLTPNATGAGAFPNSPALIRGPGGVLSQGDSGQPLQLQDATMRAQFNRTGASNYHLRLTPVVHPTITIVVPGNRGLLLQSGRGVIFASVNVEWWATQLQNLNNRLSYTDPTHLPLYLTSRHAPLHRQQSLKYRNYRLPRRGDRSRSERQRKRQRQSAGADVRVGDISLTWHLRATEWRHRLGRAGHPPVEP